MSSGIQEKTLIEILEEAKKWLLLIKKPIVSGEEFETMLFHTLKEICAQRKIRDIRRSGKQTFPDVIIWPFGIEAKSTISDSWISTGNSIVETTKVPGLKKIYMFFRKQGKAGSSDIRFKLYEECLSDIVVTHSPRYKINMDLEPKNNIFKKMGIDYDTFSKADNIKLAKEYYRKTLKNGEELWWIDQNEDAGIVPVIKNYSDLGSSDQKRFKIEARVYFPEVFSASTRKYVKVATHLLRDYQATCSSLRDLFGAGGQEIVKLRNGKQEKVPKVLYHLYNDAKDIRKFLRSADKDVLAKMWGIKITKSTDVEESWLRLIDRQYGEAPKASEIYKAGLEIL
jgi:hypothetical protein